MADKDNENSKKKNPPPIGKTIRKKRRKGPAAAVKIPLGNKLHKYLT